jgi:putative hydrolase of the HAD superfamily
VLSELTGVLFDLDDTLFDHRGAADRAAVHWAQSLPAWSDSDQAAVDRWLELENEHFPSYARGECSLAEQRNRRVRAFHPSLAELPQDGVEEAFADYLRHYESFWQALPGAVRLVERLIASGVKVGVLTNGYPDQQRLKLERTGLFRPEVPIFASAGLGVAKPSPRAFELACAGLGTAPEHTLMIGDNYDFDVAAARAAGLRGLHFDRWARGLELGSPVTLSEVELRLFG